MVEGGVALGLVWLAIHAPKSAPGLLTAAGLVGIWALIADGPLAPVRVIGLGVHRRGLLVVAVGVAVVPFATGRAHDLVVLAPLPRGCRRAAPHRAHPPVAGRAVGSTIAPTVGRTIGLTVGGTIGLTVGGTIGLTAWNRQPLFAWAP